MIVTRKVSALCIAMYGQTVRAEVITVPSGTSMGKQVVYNLGNAQGRTFETPRAKKRGELFDARFLHHLGTDEKESGQRVS